MSAMIVSPSEFVPSQHMLFTKPKVNASGGKSIGVLNSKTRRSVLLNTPLMLTWGVNVFDNPTGKSYNLALQFPRKEFSNKETDDFLDMLKEMEKQNGKTLHYIYFRKNFSAIILTKFSSGSGW